MLHLPSATNINVRKCASLTPAQFVSVGATIPSSKGFYEALNVIFGR